MAEQGSPPGQGSTTGPGAPRPEEQAEDAIAAVRRAGTPGELDAVRVCFLGRKGSITLRLRGIGELPPGDRGAAAAALNTARDRIVAALADRRAEISAGLLGERLAQERCDVTLPPRPEATGSVHPVTQVTDEITEILAAMEFRFADGPDIEDDWHNFTALNIPPGHPARQMHDTFYLRTDAGAGDGHPLLLRTHTSPVQIRFMQSERPPFRIVATGRVYRRDSDQTHTPMFHQLEGLVIDRDIHMGHLRGTLTSFCRAFFATDLVRMRFRPSYFPFTEPSAEVDIGYRHRNGVLEVGGTENWLEILGCGMVHPAVLRNCGIDPGKWQGFAWGMGVDRLAMLKYGMPDLRAFFSPEPGWLRHYGFPAFGVPTAGQGASR